MFVEFIQDDGELVLINLNKIINLGPRDEFVTRIWVGLEQGECIDVQENYSAVVQMIRTRESGWRQAGVSHGEV